MSKKLKIVLIILLALFIIIQFFPSGKTGNQPVAGQDLFELASVPAVAGKLVKNACYDCHSQHVKYPWYSYVAPVSWLVARDVNVGREALDFGKWGTLSKRNQIKALGNVAEALEDGFMPMKIYVALHPEADLSDQDRETIINWADSYAEEILED